MLLIAKISGLGGRDFEYLKKFAGCLPGDGGAGGGEGGGVDGWN